MINLLHNYSVELMVQSCNADYLIGFTEESTETVLQSIPSYRVKGMQSHEGNAMAFLGIILEMLFHSVEYRYTRIPFIFSS